MAGAALALEATPTQSQTPLGPICSSAAQDPQTPAASAQMRDGAYRLEIRNTVLDIGRGIAVSTKTYNGQFPGPLIRCAEGQAFDVDVVNATDSPELVHWHGFMIDPEIDGATEEGSPAIPPRGACRMRVTPTPSGLRFYHTHAMAGTDLSRGLYTGLAGPVLIEPRDNPGAYDREVILTLKEFLPSFNHTEMDMAFLAPTTRDRALFDLDQAAVEDARRQGRSGGYQIGYAYYTINGRMLGAGEPVRVKQGERVLFHILNASATETRSLALPRHAFQVVALDGNPAPTPATVPTLWLGPAERLSAIVDMKAPGVWVMGDIDDAARSKGMGVVIEYAGMDSRPLWSKPPRALWDYRLFADPSAVARAPDDIIDLLIQTRYGARDGFDEFTLNGSAFSMDRLEPRIRLSQGRRYRLRIRNATDDAHPVHLHRNRFEITSVAGLPTGGVLKDVAMVGGFQETTLDFVAERRGLSLFHCHTQHHMDFGFMALFDCV